VEGAVTLPPSGWAGNLFRLGAIGGGLVLSSILRERKSKRNSIAASALALAGGLAFKWAIVYAGREVESEHGDTARSNPPPR
jgi:hypothetical protein